MLEGCKPGKVVQLVDPRALREACLFRRPWLNMHHQNWFFKTFFGFDFTRKVLKQRYRPALEVDGWVQEDGSRVLLPLTRHRCTIYNESSRMAHSASKPNWLCRQSVTLRNTDPQPRGKPGYFPPKKVSKHVKLLGTATNYNHFVSPTLSLDCVPSERNTKSECKLK